MMNLALNLGEKQEVTREAECLDITVLNRY